MTTIGAWERIDRGKVVSVRMCQCSSSDAMYMKGVLGMLGARGASGQSLWIQPER